MQGTKSLGHIAGTFTGGDVPVANLTSPTASGVALAANATAAGQTVPTAKSGTGSQVAQANTPAVATSVPRTVPGVQKAAPPTPSDGISSLNRVGSASAMFPSLSAALIAPAAAPAPNPYNTLTPGTDASKLSAMVVELLLTGQNLYPFSEADQYAIATTVNTLISPYPHIVELSNIGVSLCSLLCLMHAFLSNPHKQSCNAVVACTDFHEYMILKVLRVPGCRLWR